MQLQFNDNFERGRSRSRDRQFSETSGEMIQVIVGLGQVWKPVQIEIGLDAVSAWNMIILQKTVWNQK